MSKFPARFLVATVALLGLSGCLEINAKVNENGTGTATVILAAPSGRSPADKRSAFAGPHVTVEDVKLESTQATYKIKFDDVTKLNTSQFFRGLSTTVTRKDGTTTLVSKVGKAGKAGDAPATKSKAEPTGQESKKKETGATKASKKAEEIVFTLKLTLPGEVVDTNANEKSGNEATWKLSRAELKTLPQRSFSVTYKQPKG